jgi:GR25 family glycosyltransferase involved in LPS biosynthesis
MTQRPSKDEFQLESDIKQIGTIGCWRSHTEAAAIVNESKKPFALIFEDDVLFVEDLKEIEQGLLCLKNFVENQEFKWDLIYLGYWSFWIKPTKFISLDTKFRKSIIQKCHARCFHAYCIHRNFARKIMNETWEKQQSEKPSIFQNVPNFGIDTWSAYESKNSYCLLPLIATQAPIVSSNDRAINKKFIDLALSNPKFMKLNQYTSMVTSIFAHILLWFISPNYRKSVMA